MAKVTATTTILISPVNVFIVLFFLLGNFCLLQGVIVHNNRINLSAGPQDVTSFVGGVVELPCAAFGEFGARLQAVWRRNGVLIDQSGADDGLRRLRTLSNGSLIIDGVRRDDEGVYQCIVLDEQFGVLLSARAKLTVARLPSFTVEPQDARTYVGGVARFTCNADAIPPALIVWFHDSLPLQGDIQRVLILRSGALQIVDVGPSDVGLYYCSAFNAAGNVTSRKALLSTSENSTPSESPLRLLKSPQNLTVNVGDTALFECLFDGDASAVQFSWERIDDGRLPPIERTRRVGHNLEVLNVEPLDEGFYACVARTSPSKKLLFRPSAFLTVDYAPMVREFPVEVEKKRGEIARFACSVAAKPKPNIVWYRDGEPMIINGRNNTWPPMSQAPDVMRKNNGELVFKRELVVSCLRPEDDQAVYQCVATNAYGEASAAAVLSFPINDNPVLDLGPTNLKASTTQSDDLIRLSWDVPPALLKETAIAAFLVHFYTLDDTNEKFENRRAITAHEACEDGTHCKIMCCENTRFLPFTRYVFWVDAIMVSPAEYSAPSNETIVLTRDGATVASAPLLVRDSKQTGVVELKWDDSSMLPLPGIQTEYRIEFAEIGAVGTEIKQLFVPSVVTERQLFDLKENIEYMFRVLVKTRTGYPREEKLTGKDFPWIRHQIRSSLLVESDSQAAAPILNVVLVNSSSVVVWLQFDDDASENVVGTSCHLVLTKSGDKRIVSTVNFLNSTFRSTTLTHLEAAKYYQVSVSCADSFSDQIFTSSRVFRTPPRNFGLFTTPYRPPVLYPVDLECQMVATELSTKSMQIRWKQPGLTLVQYYNVRFSPKADEADGLNVSAHVNYKQTTSQLLTFSDMTPGVSYLFAVQTVTRDLMKSGFSDDITCEVPIDIPQAPIVLSAVQFANYTRFVVWSTDDDERIKRFYVRYKKNGAVADDAAGWTEISVGGTSKSAFLPNTTSTDVYIVNVAAENAAGRSPWSSFYFSLPIVSAVVPASTAATGNGPMVIVERISYTEGIIIGVCIAIVGIVVCLLFILLRSKRNRQNCSMMRLSTLSSSAEAAAKKQMIPDQRCLQHQQTQAICCRATPPCREMQTLLPPLMENSESDTKGAFDEVVCVKQVLLFVPPVTHSGVVDVDRLPVFEKNDLAITIESSTCDHVTELCSDLSSHSPATGSSLQSWNGHHAHVVEHYAPNHHRFVGGPRSYHNSHNSSSSMPNLTDSGICIDDACCNGGNYHRPTPSTDIERTPTTTNGFHSRHVLWLKDALIKNQRRQGLRCSSSPRKERRMLYAGGDAIGEFGASTTPASEFNATY